MVVCIPVPGAPVHGCINFFWIPIHLQSQADGPRSVAIGAVPMWTSNGITYPRTDIAKIIVGIDSWIQSRDWPIGATIAERTIPKFVIGRMTRRKEDVSEFLPSATAQVVASSVLSTEQLSCTGGCESQVVSVAVVQSLVADPQGADGQTVEGIQFGIHIIGIMGQSLVGIVHR